MATIRRNAKWLSAAALLLLGVLGGWWLLSWHAPRALASETYTPLDAVTAAQIDRLRQEVGVTDDVLAAINPSDEQAATILAAVRSWYEANSENLLARRTALADQQALVRHWASEIRLGEDAADELAAARTQLAQLTESYESYIAGVRESLGQQFSNEQLALLDQMCSQPEVPMPFRVLDLTESQRNALAEAQTTYRKRLAVAREPQQQAQLRAAYEQALANVLGPANLQQLASLSGYLGSSSERVVAAIELVLPVEDEG